MNTIRSTQLSALGEPPRPPTAPPASPPDMPPPAPEELPQPDPPPSPEQAPQPQASGYTTTAHTTLPFARGFNHPFMKSTVEISQ